MDKENVHMHNEGTMHNSNSWKYGGIGGWGSAYGQSAWYTCIKMFYFYHVQWILLVKFHMKYERKIWRISKKLYFK